MLRIAKPLGYLALCLPLLILQPGCVTTPTTGDKSASGEGLTPAEQRLRQQSSQLDVKSSVQGCLAGAAAGALVGLLVKGNREQNVLIGAAVGCGVGIGANAYVQSKRNQYQNNEQRLNSMIADVRADNERLSGLIATSKEVIAADRRKIAEIDNAYRKKSLSADEARRQLAGVKANRDHLQGTLNTLKKKEKEWVEVASIEKQSGSNTSRLDAEISTLSSRVKSMEKEVALMNKQINASPVAG